MGLEELKTYNAKLFHDSKPEPVYRSSDVLLYAKEVQRERDEFEKWLEDLMQVSSYHCDCYKMPYGLQVVKAEDVRKIIDKLNP